jgi:general secretion pathway protein K
MKMVVSCQSSVASGAVVKPEIPGNRDLVCTRSLLPAAHCPLPTNKSSLTIGDWRPATNESGVILIALLWILTALAVIALSFSRESFVEVAAARNAQSLEDSYFVARAGISAATYQLLQRYFNPSLRQPELQDVPDPTELGIMTGSLGGGVYQVNIQDESGKLNVNYVLEDQLRALTEAAGIDKQDGDIITDSILDWKDTDPAHHINGAEDDYYQALNPPYRAKNGNIDTPEELLLIRGITPEYFYGRPERDAGGSIFYKYGLSRYLTVYSQSRQINVNYAPLPVLQSIPGMPQEAAKAIYDRRHVKPFKATREINDLGVNLGTTAGQFLAVGQTDTFTLTASAHAANSNVRRVIRAVVKLEPGSKKPYRILYWNENIPDYEGMTP